LIITYYFPLWFLAQYLSMTIEFTPLLAPELSLRTPRLIRWVDKEAQLFHMAKAGDIPGVQDLFASRVVSPFDLTVAQGESALFVSTHIIYILL
jgi:hypothetical protein